MLNNYVNDLTNRCGSILLLLTVDIQFVDIKIGQSRVTVV